jgi:hypothetical protein
MSAMRGATRSPLLVVNVAANVISPVALVLPLTGTVKVVLVAFAGKLRFCVVPM